MFATQYGLEKVPNTGPIAVRVETVSSEKAGRVYDKISGLENGRLLRFRSDVTLKEWVSRDPANHTPVTMRELETMLGTAHKTMTRIAEDGEAEYEHIAGVAYRREHGHANDDHYIAVGQTDRYGTVMKDGQDIARVVYTATKGEIPPSMSVCHTCRVSNCVNPDHLGLTDRHTRTSMTTSRLSAEQVRDIRRLLDENRSEDKDTMGRPRRKEGQLTNRDIATKFGVSESMVSRIDSRSRKER
ncbi:MAG TPA: HNH endonuclease [Gemmatimonadaceae bacterium]|jgi:hypothetical protein